MEPQHKYENVRVAQPEDMEECRSSTEVESLIDDEKHWGTQPRRTTRRSKAASCFASYRWLIDTGLLLVILGLLVRQQLHEPPVNKWEIGGDFTGVGPSCKSTA